MSAGNYATSWKDSVELPVGILKTARFVARNSLLSIMAAFPGSNANAFLRGLYCHYVFDDQRAQFERLIVDLKKQGTFIDTDICIEMLQGKRKIDGRYFHLSFDDGFRNIYTNAFPVLKKHNVPAVHFVPSALMGADFQHTARYCLEVTRYRSVIEMCTWDDLREMAAAGIEIGSHTRTHTQMTLLSGNVVQLESEIAGSKKEIEDHLGRECRFFAWPYGKRTDVTAEILGQIDKAGYQACFGAYRGSIIPGKTNIMSIPRHLFETQWPLSHINFFASGRADFLVKE